ncbi:MAG: hypothetical protein IJO57_01300 [Bacilli bacterium]|nr:hypothetical protein [bacterium]MBQ9853653.1 hypothetical protein [Bacilli bacterium]
MKNILMYYYDLHPENIHQKGDIYYFKIKNEKYYILPFLRSNEELRSIYDINKELIEKNILIHKIILNKQNNILIQFNGINYILLKCYLKNDRKVYLKDINFLESNTNIIKKDTILNKSNWVSLWENKNDYLEYQISQFGINHPVVVDFFAYYIGLAENAILYAKNTSIEINPNYLDNLVICHKRINNNSTLFNLFNPLEFVIDHKTRDIAEYIKFKFFYDKSNLWDEIHMYFSNNNLSVYGVRMFYARLLYPTYFFDIYDEILEGSSNEKDLVHIVEKQEEYEEFLVDIYNFLKLKYNIPEIEWLIKE